jgi:hypothetical protein
LFGLNLSPVSSGTNVWRAAFENQLSEQRMFENVASEFAKLFTRTVGWLAMDVALYQGNSIASKRKKREDGSDDSEPLSENGNFIFLSTLSL